MEYVFYALAYLLISFVCSTIVGRAIAVGSGDR